jgi:hypothetical protein
MPQEWVRVTDSVAHESRIRYESLVLGILLFFLGITGHFSMIPTRYLPMRPDTSILVEPLILGRIVFLKITRHFSIALDHGRSLSTPLHVCITGDTCPTRCVAEITEFGDSRATVFLQGTPSHPLLKVRDPGKHLEMQLPSGRAVTSASTPRSTLQDGRQNMEGHKAIEKPQARRTCAQPFTHAQPAAGDQGATVASNLDRARNVHAVARSLHPQSMRHSVVVKENFLVMPRCAKHAKPGCDMPVTHSLSFLGFWTWALVLDSNCTRFCRRLRKAPGRYDLK